MKFPRLFGRGRTNKALAAYQRELVDTHYREVENMYRQMRVWRHDYRNHIQTLKVLAADGNMDAIRKYLDGLDTELRELDTPIKSGNAMADAILNSKVSLAKARGIDVRVDARIPIRLRISELDLCCVLGNLFDNAIEANAPLPESDRMIRVYMDMKGTQLYISFTNAAPAVKKRKVGGLFRTTKRGGGHGFGLVSVDRIVEDAGGYLSRNSESGAFTTEILLPQG
ncbi:sensor histidine kinase [Bifidobacterium avesanii]|uniref:GHKL domain-containing protein n=1 Tax=Bifidobacterium avesanii TaxID=1798157 RepID=A0A7K3TI30_9BIFI|nr:GHKL domain-containing protein [Bifidobacterium avesanii]KAB8288251.1 histidine kinase [Bifidobacterium avesanii]NEG78712.1 GHKL domain-containing protein [Bifidobacterium avesanii]